MADANLAVYADLRVRNKGGILEAVTAASPEWRRVHATQVLQDSLVMRRVTI
jgi:hypothetical protein